MKPPVPEFSRPLPVDRIPREGCEEHIAAEAHECVALAKRLGIPAVHSVRADLRAEPWRGGGIKLTGTVASDLDQVSVVSLNPFRHRVEYPVTRFFLPEAVAVVEEESEADPIVAGHIDLGEIAAETLALELDPYPRQDGEAFEAHIEADDAEPGKQSPFAALAKRPPP